MITSYLAFLDILGFSAIVGSDRTGEQIERYRKSVSDATENLAVKSVVFSDSIVLTTDDPAQESLLVLARATARLMCNLLHADIPIRGAIAHGEFSRSIVGEGVFVAGRALIEAYQWEQKQDWVGVMITPSALRTVPNMKKLCPRPDTCNPSLMNPWMEVIQHHPRIPFHSSVPYMTPTFDGFALVPTKGESTHHLWYNLRLSLERLESLRMTAPSPESQQKYQRTLEWLNVLFEGWRHLAASSDS
jgi:hypothetical protein